MRSKLLWALAALPSLVWTCQAETISLRGGAKIEADLLRQDNAGVVVDLGYELLRIPKDSVAKVEKDKPAPGGAPAAAAPAGSLYSSDSPKDKDVTHPVASFTPSVPLVQTPKGLGSGFFINRDGYLVTNFHVIKGERHITVTRMVQNGQDSQRVVYKKIRIVAVDPFHDLAVLKIEDDIKDKIVPLTLASRETPSIGDSVYVIGNPLGLERTVTEGVLSHAARNFGGNLYLQIDAPVNPGNSGGPLFNSQGQVIGVINMGILAMEGLNFAIPVRDVKFLLDNLDAYAFDANNPVSGYVYPAPPRNPGKGKNQK